MRKKLICIWCNKNCIIEMDSKGAPQQCMVASEGGYTWKECSINKKNKQQISEAINLIQKIADKKFNYLPGYPSMCGVFEIIKQAHRIST